MWAQVDIRGSEKLAWLKYALRQKAARGDVVHQPLDGLGTGACGQVPALKDAAPPPRPPAGWQQDQAGARQVFAPSAGTAHRVTSCARQWEVLRVAGAKSMASGLSLQPQGDAICSFDV